MGSVKFGDVVKDSVTGLKGIATGRIEYMNGCVRIAIQAKCRKDGKVPDPEWVDEGQVIVTKPKMMPKPLKRPGGPGPVPVRRTGPAFR